MDAQILELPFDIKALKGLSEKLVRSHHEVNYAGAIKRLNAIRAQLRDLPFTSMQGFQLNGLKREELLATNSMLLHELYFDCLGGDGEAPTPGMVLALQANFGSEARWRDEFIAMGKALAGGSGWVLLTFQPRDGTLVNQWSADHTNAVAGGIPILALDMYEHAYHMEFGAAASRYVDAFMDNINWASVYERYQRAVDASSGSLSASHEDLLGAHVLDVRRAGAYERADTVIPGAIRRDPTSLDEWAGSLPTDEPVVVYCIYGHEVGRSTAMRLRAAGVNARFLRGGIEGWTAAGNPLQPKEGTS